MPCPPPPKWRRSEADPECSSEITVDETPVVADVSPALHAHGARDGAASQAGCAGQLLEGMVADGAVKLAQAALRGKTASDEKKWAAQGADRRGRTISSGIRWKAHASDGSELHGRGNADRSKSPRRRHADMVQD